MATPFSSMRLAVACTLTAAMLAACGGSQMSGSSLGTAPQAAGASNSQHSTILPADHGGGCGGDTRGGFGPNDGRGCCGDGGDSRQGGLGPNHEGHGCCRGDGDSRQGGNGLRSNDDEGGHCGSSSISVRPRHVYFTPSYPGPVTVTVKTRQQGTVTEFDTCGGASGIATVTQGSGNQWTVTAGAQQGSCKALFVLKNGSGHKIGQAVLHITNFL
jgi:hypothetical protein